MHNLTNIRRGMTCVVYIHAYIPIAAYVTIRNGT